ncbi:MAG: AzlD domain-containing protein [Polaromonas sp.]|uniref:AzlD family protein n=1 Tax=Polaromonas sp. TaxID=1869339 RepID=UPI002489F1A7|nr:AzlD domain-containing protein [Polaromonas sp.]MDI1237459.1 AzlD domain-containing protein [Polaromonas sp.]
MAVESTFLLALVGMAVASFACRISGFLLMGYVRITPRVEAALKAIPLSVMVGIVTPAATSGKLPELLGLLAVGLAMKLVRNDLAAAVAGAVTVAVARWAMS